MSCVVVDLLHLAVSQHLPTAGNPADHRLLLLPPSMLVSQVGLDISELPGANVTDFLNTETQFFN